MTELKFEDGQVPDDETIKKWLKIVVDFFDENKQKKRLQAEVIAGLEKKDGDPVDQEAAMKAAA